MSFFSLFTRRIMLTRNVMLFHSISSQHSYSQINECIVLKLIFFWWLITTEAVIATIRYLIDWWNHFAILFASPSLFFISCRLTHVRQTKFDIQMHQCCLSVAYRPISFFHFLDVFKINLIESFQVIYIQVIPISSLDLRYNAYDSDRTI